MTSERVILAHERYNLKELGSRKGKIEVNEAVAEGVIFKIMELRVS